MGTTSRLARSPLPTPASGWRTLFEDQTPERIRDALDLTVWWRSEVATATEAFGPHLDAVLAEVEEEARRELAARAITPAPRSPRIDVRLIKERVDVAGYVAKRAPVRYEAGRGRELRTRCPFPDHPDTTPSFYVNPDKGVFRCFGCGRGGDVISFVMQWDGDSFVEAIDRLAWEAGVDVPAGNAAPAAPVRLRVSGGREARS